MNSILSWLRAPALVLVAGLALSSCATGTAPGKSQAPGAGLAEYTHLVTHSRNEIDATLECLAKFRRQKAPCSPHMLAAFSKAVDRLAAESVPVRARSQAMLARGDAYFENWHANMAQVSDQRIRERAEQHRAELQQGLIKLKLLAKQGRDPFQSFLTGLRGLRAMVESDPYAIQAETTRELAGRTEVSGREVAQGLDAMAAELRAMTLMLLPSGRNQ